MKINDLDIKDIKPLFLETNIKANKFIPVINEFKDHFLIADKIEKPILMPALPEVDIFKQAEISWKEVEGFEFQKMDVDGFFDRIHKII